MDHLGTFEFTQSVAPGLSDEQSLSVPLSRQSKETVNDPISLLACLSVHGQTGRWGSHWLSSVSSRVIHELHHDVMLIGYNQLRGWISLQMALLSSLKRKTVIIRSWYKDKGSKNIHMIVTQVFCVWNGWVYNFVCQAFSTCFLTCCSCHFL